MLIKRLKDLGARDGFTNDGILVISRVVKEGICISFHKDNLENSKLVPWLNLSSSVDEYDVLDQSFREGLTEFREALNGSAS